MTSRGGSRDLESQEEDRELQDDLTIIVRILQVASEEATIYLQLCKEAEGQNEAVANEAEVATEGQEEEATGETDAAEAKQE